MNKSRTKLIEVLWAIFFTVVFGVIIGIIPAACYFGREMTTMQGLIAICFGMPTYWAIMLVRKALKK